MIPDDTRPETAASEPAPLEPADLTASVANSSADDPSSDDTVFGNETDIPMAVDVDDSPDLSGLSGSAKTPETIDDDVEEDDPDLEEESSEKELAASEAFEHNYKSIIEALVFASDEPLTFRQIKDVIIGPEEPAVEGIEPAADDGAAGDVVEEYEPGQRSRRKREILPFTINLVRRCIDALNTEYRQAGRSFRVTEIAGGFAFQTTHEFGGYVGRLFAERSKRRLSQSALETLAIIAFKQPISKPAIEAIRGVNADFVLKSLLERNLIAIVGRDSSVGRPLLYGTTKVFLKHFGLKNLDDLPKPREIQELLAEERERDNLYVADIDERKTAELHHVSEDGHLFDTLPMEEEYLPALEDATPDQLALESNRGFAEPPAAADFDENDHDAASDIAVESRAEERAADFDESDHDAASDIAVESGAEERATDFDERDNDESLPSEFHPDTPRTDAAISGSSSGDTPGEVEDAHNPQESHAPLHPDLDGASPESSIPDPS
jgi:segregation and condensation protein B